MKKLNVAAIAVMTSAIVMNGITVSAADWSQASYADSDPSTVNIVSTNNDSVTFENSATNTDICKLRITLDKVLKNRDDYAKVASVKWKVTYNNVSPDLTADAFSGGTYLTNGGSVGYTIRCDEYDEENEKGIWNETSYSIEDWYDVPKSNPLEKDGELVFMDWSYADIGNQGVSVTVSDLKFYDNDGKEIEQLGYEEWTEDMSSDVVDSGSGNPSHTEKTENETGDASEEAVEEAADAADTDKISTEAEAVSETTVPIEEAPATGNVGTYLAAISLIGAVGGLCAVRRRK